MSGNIMNDKEAREHSVVVNIPLKIGINLTNRYVHWMILRLHLDKGCVSY